MHCML